MKNAPCFDLPEEQKEWFFGTYDYGKARKFCHANCSEAVREKCLQVALESEVPGEQRYGVYGGMSAEARTKLYG